MSDSEERQQAFVEARKAGETYDAIARRHGVTEGTVRYWVRKAGGGGTGERQRGPGRPPLLGPDEVVQFEQLLTERSTATLESILGELERQTGKRLKEGTARQYLRRLGIRRVRPGVEEVADDAAKGRTTRYLPRHRREGDRESYPSDLTDAEWDLLRPVFDRGGQPGRPPRYPRRRILDAIFYVVRSGVPWRLLPRDLPPWQNVYAHFRRWSDAGWFETMHDQLRARWRQREGKEPQATAAIIDSQSVKTTEKGGPGATTRERRPRGGSATSS